MKLSFGVFFSYNLFTVQKHLPFLGGNVPSGQTANYLQAEFVSVFQLENCMKRLVFHSYSLLVFSPCHSYPVVCEVRNLWQRLFLCF